MSDGTWIIDATIAASVAPAGVSESSDQPFSVVINHFATEDIPHLRASLIFAAALSVQNPLVREVIVVDGSAQRDERLSEELVSFGARYHHAGRSLSFSEGYNIGAQLCTSRWLVLSASDVYPPLDFYQDVNKLIKHTSLAIGCIIPRLTVTDLPFQDSRLKRRQTCSVPLMTLNLNVFERTTFFEIGQVPECYSGAYNDVELSLRIRASGRSILMMPTVCTHYGRLTWSTTSSNYRYLNDRDNFFARFPQYAKKGDFWDIDSAKVCGGRLGFCIRIVRAFSFPSKRLAMVHRVLRAVPWMKSLRLLAK